MSIPDIFMHTVYTVTAATGEYEDHNTTVLGFFLTEASANAMVKQLEDEYSDWDEEATYPHPGGDSTHSYTSEKRYQEGYCDDKSIAVYIDYTGVSFNVNKINNLKDLLF